jgi:putative sporulation protein YtaF
VDWLFIIGLAIASSIDNLAVGFSYGLVGLRIGVGANVIIAVICFLFSQAGTLFGKWIGTILPGSLPDFVGVVLLLLLGLRILLLVMPRERLTNALGEADRRSESAEGERGNGRAAGIGVLESVLLGIALSANALANAVSAGILSMSPTAISLTAALGSLLTVAAGVELGLRAAQLRFGQFGLKRMGTLVSGSILIALVLAKMIK